MIKRECIVCGEIFETLAKEIRRGKGKVCSLSCAASLSAQNRDQSGERNPNWKGGKSDNTGRKRRYRENNPEKHRAHRLMWNAIRRGDLVRETCAVCGAHKVEGHHEDYSKPLDVIWLCKKHHLEAHKGKFGK